ncbi:SecY-interacting protein [Providencia sp. 21OH12SH02B-Prov]|uniref:Protein Syd n=1 Tax=Providencia stuartii TaxID=588 RepID=A0AAI9MVT1_PROST|nr:MULTISPECIES: SecY-interacting protein [Providencia]ELR5034435.1 SecY-interacting protein [Providencia stuartii]ELZ5938547.1 SecY-interacting protein [Providencia stuartii]MCK1141815.1 SecY-interacting protein [Providencia stuartii]QIC17021.1 SecY-interacting protein [Providencia vermicola]WBA57912.1 SecY-interacting protein [Providencia sp. 21OH12SH02B-Prov]
MNITVSEALTQFTEQYVSKWMAQTGLPPASSDLYGIPSPCIVRTGENWVYWEPQSFSLQDKNLNKVATALDIELQPMIHPFYTTQLAGDMKAQFQGHTLNLVQVWNEDDFIRLQENLIGHLVTQKRLKLSPTLFIATLESDLEMISLCNLTGEIILEKFGSKEKQVLAPDLIHFIQQLSPVVEPLA